MSMAITPSLPLPSPKTFELQQATSSNSAPALPAELSGTAKPTDQEAREAFDSFVGQTFYGQMLSAMRKTQTEPAYFHGGQAEKAFQAQFDQVIAEKLSESSAHSLTGPMFELFQLSRR